MHRFCIFFHRESAVSEKGLCRKFRHYHTRGSPSARAAVPRYPHFENSQWNDLPVFCYTPRMTNEQWNAFTAFRSRFRDQCAIWAKQAELSPQGWLGTLQQAAADADENPAYPLENPIVYNHSLDGLTREDTIKLIIVGDNPGKDEQLQINRRYLVGQAGKLGDGFFRKNPELGVDFRKNVVILNKTPIHTAKTKQLDYIQNKGGARFTALFEETQRWMAKETADLQKALGCGLWLVGYGELRSTGLFSVYADELREQYMSESNGFKGIGSVLLFQHFSMNRFSIDLMQRYLKNLSLEDNLKALGFAHRAEILGW